MSWGGPAIRNKTFFWIATEGYRTNSTASGSLIMPTDLERTGDFSRSFDRNGNLVVLYDPLTTRPNPTGWLGLPSTRTRFRKRDSAGTAFSTVTAPERTSLGSCRTPTEQRSGADGLSNYQLTSQIPTEAEQYVLKGEHKLNDKVSITGLYLYQNTDEAHSHFWGEEFPYAGPDQGDEVRRVHVIALNNTIIASPTTVVTLRYGWTFFGDHVTGIPYNSGSIRFNSAFINDVQYLGFRRHHLRVPDALGTRAESPVNYRSWAVNSGVSKFVGRTHSNPAPTSADRRRRVGCTAPPAETSTSTRSGRSVIRSWRHPIGECVRELSAGVSDGQSQQPSSAPVSTPIDAFIRYYAGYVQDDFRVGSKLTLNFGIRYEYRIRPHERDHLPCRVRSLNAASPLAARAGLDLRGGLRYAGQDGFPDYQGDPSKKKISPRVGFAWSASDKTVLRGGYGLFWSPWVYPGPGSSNWGQLGYTRETFTPINRTV